MSIRVHLREVTEGDLPILFEHQREPEAVRMAAFPPRDWDALQLHWRKLLSDETVWAKAVVVNGQMVGNIASWLQDQRRLVGYWYGKEHWGQGIATEALTRYLQVFTDRPLYAYAANTNLGSIRVLEKCGFVECSGDQAGTVGELTAGVKEQLFKLT